MKILKSVLCLAALFSISLCETNISKITLAIHFFILLNSILVVVMDEGNSAAENGVKEGVSFAETNNLGTITTKQFIKLEHSDPSQASKKCILFLVF